MKHLPKKLLILGGLSIGVLLLWVCASRFNQLKRTNLNDLNHLQSLVSQRQIIYEKLPNNIAFNEKSTQRLSPKLKRIKSNYQNAHHLYQSSISLTTKKAAMQQESHFSKSYLNTIYDESKASHALAKEALIANVQKIQNLNIVLNDFQSQTTYSTKRLKQYIQHHPYDPFVVINQNTYELTSQLVTNELDSTYDMNRLLTVR